MELYYKNDAFFKFCFGKNSKISCRLRTFMIQSVLDISYQDSTVLNPELTAQMVNDKKIILDVLSSNDDLIVDLEMQTSRLTHYLHYRFIYYAYRLITNQLEIGDSYDLLKKAVLIVFINDMDVNNPAFITAYSLHDEKTRRKYRYNLDRIIYVHMPYIKEIAKEKEVLSEFEALVYLLYTNSLKGIKWESQEGVIDMLGKRYRQFMQGKLYKSALSRQHNYIDYEAYTKSLYEDAKEEGIYDHAKEMFKTFMLKKYQKCDDELVDHLTLEALNEGIVLMSENISYPELKKRLL